MFQTNQRGVCLFVCLLFFIISHAAYHLNDIGISYLFLFQNTVTPWLQRWLFPFVWVDFTRGATSLSVSCKLWGDFVFISRKWLSFSPPSWFRQKQTDYHDRITVILKTFSTLRHVWKNKTKLTLWSEWSKQHLWTCKTIVGRKKQWKCTAFTLHTMLTWMVITCHFHTFLSNDNILTFQTLLEFPGHVASHC